MAQQREGEPAVRVAPAAPAEAAPLATQTNPASAASGSAVPSSSVSSTPSTAEDKRSDEQKASDERLDAQCMLIDFLPQLASYNYVWRHHSDNDNIVTSKANGGGGLNNPYMVGMWGDGEQFSSNVHGSTKKSKFLDFTTAQLSSLVPIMKFYKIQQLESGENKDYLIPFSTHALYFATSTWT